VWGTGTAACKAAIRLRFDGAADDATLASFDLPITTIGGNNLGMLMTSAMKIPLSEQVAVFPRILT
jgi:hypothetical protein